VTSKFFFINIFALQSGVHSLLFQEGLVMSIFFYLFQSTI